VVDPTAFKELWWNWADDPQGLGRTMAYGATMREDPHSSNCHQIFEAGVFIAGCGKSSIFGYGPGMLGSMMRDGDVPATFTASPYWVNWDGGFAGSTYQISTTYLESHPSRSQYLASAYEKKQWFDHRPLLGDPAIATSGNVTKVGTYLYRISAAATASMQYRMQGYIATAGEKVLVDVSPAVLADTTADAFKYCVVVVSGDCAVGSTSGQVYLNVPQAWAGYVVPSRFSALPFSIRDVALTQNTHTAASIVQAGSGGQDQIGAVVRRLTSGFAPYKVQSLYWNGRATPDGRRYYWKTDLLDAVAGALLIADVPAWPARDSMFRGDFIQIPIKMGGKPGDQVRIRFGYSENGHPESSFCHERQVACATDATGAQPFLWTDETQQWKACDSGCTISIPAISGRVLYYMVDRRNSGVSNSSPLDAIAVP